MANFGVRLGLYNLSYLGVNAAANVAGKYSRGHMENGLNERVWVGTETFQQKINVIGLCT